jgi:hypothetical protein
LPGRTGENNNRSQSGHKTDDEIIKKTRKQNIKEVKHKQERVQTFERARI